MSHHIYQMDFLMLYVYRTAPFYHPLQAACTLRGMLYRERAEYPLTSFLCTTQVTAQISREISTGSADNPELITKW